MKSKLFIFSILALILSLPVLAQEKKEKSYAPKAGTVQFELIFGSNGNIATSSSLSYLLASDTGSAIGLPNSDPKTYLNLSNMNSSSAANMIGMKAAVFVHPQIDINVMFGMTTNITPKKDYIEGDNSVPDMPIPAQKYITAQTENMLQSELGLNWHFNTKNERVSPYIGAVGGFQFARIQAMYPYTGETNSDGDPIELTRNSYRAGQAWALQGGVVLGIDYSVAAGLTIGFEICPAKYQYNVFELHPSGLDLYRVSNHHIRFLTNPRLKLGFRF